jgi:alanine dehydrogenase
MLVLSNEDVERLLPMPDCIAALEPMYADYANGKALLSPRVDNIAPAKLEGAYYAFKHMGGTWPGRGVQALRLNSDIITHPLVAGKPRRVKRPLAGGRWVGMVLLFSTETGALLAMFPDGVMQRLRVGAANAIALKHLAREDARTLALVGSGWQAGAQLMAALAVRPFREVRVFSPRKDSREAFVAGARKRHPGVEITAVESAEACVAGADVIAAATSSMVRVLDPAWLEPGVHASCIKTQEVDGEVFDRCDRVVMHTSKQTKQIDNIQPGTPNVTAEHEDGWWNEPGRQVASFPDLPQLVAGAAPGRRRSDEITCFVNNVGMGLQFAAAGALVFERAREAGVGHVLPDEWFTEDVHP